MSRIGNNASLSSPNKSELSSLSSQHIATTQAQQYTSFFLSALPNAEPYDKLSFPFNAPRQLKPNGALYAFLLPILFRFSAFPLPCFPASSCSRAFARCTFSFRLGSLPVGKAAVLKVIDRLQAADEMLVVGCEEQGGIVFAVKV